ncbi:MAG: hypothetical protein ABI037_02890 [Gemmatimonadales bacterium]
MSEGDRIARLEERVGRLEEALSRAAGQRGSGAVEQRDSGTATTGARASCCSSSTDTAYCSITGDCPAAPPPRSPAEF